MLLCMVIWVELVFVYFGLIVCCGCLCGGNLFCLGYFVCFQVNFNLKTPTFKVDLRKNGKTYVYETNSMILVIIFFN